MIVKDIISIIQEFAPLDLQCDFDNCGLLIGNEENKVTGVTVCVDATLEVLKDAVSRGDNMIVCHHPIIFNGIKRLDEVLESEVLFAVRNQLNIYAAHTSVDSCDGGNNSETLKALGMRDIKSESCSRIGVLHTPITLNELIDKCTALGYKNIRTVSGKKSIEFVGVCTGAGGDYRTAEFFIDNKVDCVITSELKHNVALTYKKLGINVIETTHYDSERIFERIMQSVIAKKTKGLTINLSKASKDVYDI